MQGAICLSASFDWRLKAVRECLSSGPAGQCIRSKCVCAEHVCIEACVCIEAGISKHAYFYSNIFRGLYRLVLKGKHKRLTSKAMFITCWPQRWINKDFWKERVKVRKTYLKAGVEVLELELLPGRFWNSKSCPRGFSFGSKSYHRRLTLSLKKLLCVGCSG